MTDTTSPRLHDARARARAVDDGMDAAFLRTARASGERWHSRVRARPLLAITVLLTTGASLALAFVDELQRNLPQSEVIVTLALASALATAVLLWLRTDLLDDTRVGWVAPGYVAAGLLMLLSVEQVPDLAATLSIGGDSLQETGNALNRAFALHLSWHLAFAGAALGGLLLEHRTVLRRIYLLGTLGLGLLLATGSYPSELALVRFDPSRGQDAVQLTALYWSLASSALIILVGTALAWFLTVGSRPPVARAWIGVSVALVAVEMAFQMLSTTASPRFFTASLVMQALAFAVSLGGQLFGIRSTIAGQFEFERDVARRYAAGTVLDAPGPDHRPADQAITGAEIRAILGGEGSLCMHLQPIVRVTDGQVAGFEALARFGPTTNGAQLPPDVWFTAAARQGLGLPLELAAVRLAVAQIPDLPAGARLSLNVGPATLLSDPLLHLLQKVDASRVTVELTEHAPIDDYAAMVVALDRLRAVGVRVAVDDAGAGFSSMRHITRLGPDVLKIDISLIRDLDRLPLGRAMVAALVAYADRTGANLVAEGVESREEAIALWSLGVEYGQGWHWSKALPPADAIAFNANKAGNDANAGKSTTR